MNIVKLQVTTPTVVHPISLVCLFLTFPWSVRLGRQRTFFRSRPRQT
jgi:hypothetical protein